MLKYIVFTRLKTIEELAIALSTLFNCWLPGPNIIGPARRGGTASRAEPSTSGTLAEALAKAAAPDWGLVPRRNETARGNCPTGAAA